MAKDEGVGSILDNLIRMFFTENLFKAALEMDLLPVDRVQHRLRGFAHDDGRSGCRADGHDHANL